MNDFDELLRKARENGKPTIDGLFEMLYPELRLAVRNCVGSGRAGQPVHPTELLGEAFLRLRRRPGSYWKDKKHFILTVARAVRFALVDAIHDEDVLRLQREGRERVTMTLVGNEPPLAPERLMALHLALERLRQEREGLRRGGEVIELQFFAGYSREEIAEALGISTRQVLRDFTATRLMLRKEIGF